MLRWRIILNNGLAVEEPTDGASVRIADRNLSELQVINDTGNPLCRFTMEPGDVPIFYRVRGATIGQFHNPETDAVVYGKARDAGNNIDATLRAYIKGNDVDCPTWAFDQTMVEELFNY